MKSKIHVLLSLLIGFSSLALCQPQKNYKMTFFFYMVADVSKEDDILFSCRQMELAGVPHNMRILFYLVRTRKGQPIDYMDGSIVDHKMNGLRKPAAGQGHDKLFLKGLREALQVKSNHFCLAICFKPVQEVQQARGSFILLPALRDALKECVAVKKKPLDLIILDAGLTATEQVVRVFNPYARFLFASQTPYRNFGLPYNLMIEAFKSGNNTPTTLGCALVRAHKNYYDILTKDYSAALFDLQTLEPLAKILSDMGQSFVQRLKQANLADYGAENYFDLLTACRTILTNTKNKAVQEAQLRNKLVQAGALISKGTLCHVEGHPSGKGLSVFVPIRKGSRRS